MREAAEWVSVWDGNIAVTTDCTIVDGHKIVDVEVVDAEDDDLGTLDYEYVRYHDKKFNVDTERMVLLEERK